MDDVNFVPPSAAGVNTRKQVLHKYTTALRQLRTIAEQTHKVRPFYFDNYVLSQYFQQRSAESELDISGYVSQTPLTFLKLELFTHILDRRRQILYWLLYLLLISLCVFAYRFQYESPDSVEGGERSVHSYVYPSMRMWRRITLPLIQRFPQLTELYDESCLMQNPFFQVEDLSCEPCAKVQNVLDLTQVDEEAALLREKNDGSGGIKVKSGAVDTQPAEFVPYVFKIQQAPIQLHDFYKVYISNHEVFRRDAYRVQSTNREITNLEELFNQFNYTSPVEVHNLWRCNRMLPARLLRQLFVSPTMRFPRTGIALERYMAIDSAQAPAYTLPDTECANVYVQQALGTRYIFLRPTSECRHRCRTLSLRLPQASVLSYNWWYWKPISAPDPVSDTLSITLIGSYC